MTHNTDGNLAALRSYEREQDALAAADQAHEDAISELADELFDAYITGDADVIDEVDDWLRDYPWTDRVRAAMVKERELLVMGRGGAMYKMGQAAISEACEAIAKGRMG
jgi:hypothetical protein